MFTLTKRQKDIINHLLITNELSTIKKIASVFGVSERTIRYDLDSVESWLNERGINLIRKPGTGISIEQSKLNKVEILEQLADVDNIDYSTEERQFYKTCPFFVH